MALLVQKFGGTSVGTVERIEAALLQNENILIFGDYDV